MKKLLLLLGILGLAVVIRYLIDPEGSRTTRDRMVGKLRRSTEDAADTVVDVTDAASDAISDAAKAIDDAVPSPN